MEIIKNGTVTLVAFFQTSDGSPVTGKTLAEVLFDINYVDGTAPSAGNAADRELGDGWYAYDYTDSNAIDFVYIARDSTATYKNFPGGRVHIKQIEFIDLDHSHANSTSEQAVITEPLTVPTKLGPFLFEIAALTQIVTVKLQVKINGANYRVIEQADWDPGDTDGLGTNIIESDEDVKITFQSASAEGSIKTVPYLYKKEVL